ncbi:hypothetical protein J4Q44_G00269170 [Coregonus suidteri]|uniref:Uncharacterized protein n=1 Tax=Coregonus suidteri TaxID=861788 RepID=A0AAN8L4R7_9TELE
MWEGFKSHVTDEGSGKHLDEAARPENVFITNFIQLHHPIQTIHTVQSLSPIQKLSRSYTSSSYNTLMRSKRPGPMTITHSDAPSFHFLFVMMLSRIHSEVALLLAPIPCCQTTSTT